MRSLDQRNGTWGVAGHRPGDTQSRWSRQDGASAGFGGRSGGETPWRVRGQASVRRVNEWRQSRQRYTGRVGDQTGRVGAQRCQRAGRGSGVFESPGDEQKPRHQLRQEWRELRGSSPGLLSRPGQRGPCRPPACLTSGTSVACLLCVEAVAEGRRPRFSLTVPQRNCPRLI